MTAYGYSLHGWGKNLMNMNIATPVAVYSDDDAVLFVVISHMLYLTLFTHSLNKGWVEKLYKPILRLIIRDSSPDAYS
jgi:hypothetical protein